MAAATTESLLGRPALMRPETAKPSNMYKLWSLVHFSCGVAALALGIYYINATGEGQRVYTVTHQSLRFYVFIGLYIAATSMLGVFAALAPLKRKRLLHIYVGLLGLGIVIMVCVSLWLWTYTLDINGYYGQMWRTQWSDDIKLAFENDGSCCGYLSRDDSPMASAPACVDQSIKHGCMYTVIFYGQACHSYIYAGLITCSIISLFSAIAGLMLIIDCNAEKRVRRSHAYQWRRRMAARKASSAASRSTTTTINVHSAYGPQHEE
ncbi:hypothetical protein H4R21_006720 [Coemansia helicoidea]|uniref:Uncharacterized protein n=1 Tax=Coemansia helicoidea TaxID=1286919 RepID=A0ACC1KGV5_9FUNG|nr:hypothetical protein H4R21_006720 [Coemansia helicoidea]